jgi:hypothetical protein
VLDVMLYISGIILWSADPWGSATPTQGGPRLFRKLNNFSQQINEVKIRKEAKSEIENFKTLTASTFPLKLKFRFLYIFSFVEKIKYFVICVFVVYCFEVQIVEMA